MFFLFEPPGDGGGGNLYKMGGDVGGWGELKEDECVCFCLVCIFHNKKMHVYLIHSLKRLAYHE